MRKKTAIKAFYRQYKDLCRRALFLLFTLSVFQCMSANVLENADKTKETKELEQGNVTIKGSIKDQTGEPLGGVSIVIKGTTTGVISDIDGLYSINVPNANATLVFSFIGFHSQEIAIGNKTSIDVVLQEDAKMLDDVVVVGYGTMKRREVTSSVETIKAEKFNAGGSRSAMDLIQGKVAGLNMTRVNGSNPNSGMDIQLRGVTSLKGDRSPLIVIDGVPGGNLDLLQQDDIESFNVLKDGSAAAIYGTRANAGVILITTKKGKAGKAQFDYSTYIQHEVVNDKPKILSASQFRDLIKQGLVKEDQDFGSSTDLFDELINKDNLSQYHNLSMSGGTQNTNYRASLFYSKMEGITNQNNREQFGGRININQRGLNDKLLVSMNLATNLNNANLLGGQTGYFEQAIQRNPTAPLYNEDGSFYETHAFNNYNPLSRLAYRLSKRSQQTTAADVRVQLDLIEGLNLVATGAYQRDSYNDREYRSIKDWDQRVGTDYQGMAYARKANYLQWSKSFEATANYRRTFNEKHTVTALLGYSYQYSTTEKFDVNNNGFTTDGFLDWNLGAGSAINNTKLPRPGMSSNKVDNTLVAFFGRINYSFLDRYFLQALLRHEGSSKFGANHRWGNFPAVSAGWTISEEEFMKDIEPINELKLRVGYGVTGNQGIDPYQSVVTLGTGGVYPQDGVYYQTYGAARNPNPDLKWEQKAEWNLGLDFTILNNKITGSVDIYERNTKDLLYEYNAQQPPYVRDKILMNVGTLRSSGVEIQISATAIENKDFTWNIDFAGNTSSNKLTKLSNEVFKANWLTFYGLPSPGNLGDAIRLEEGGKLGNFYGKRFAGFTEEGKWLFYKKDGTTGTASELSDEDKTVIGNGVPKLQASLTQRFTYKNFDLTIMFRGKFGFDILNLKDLYFGNKKWLPNNLIESAITKHSQLNDDPQYSDYYIEKGDFVKLDNLTLGYNFNIKSSYIRNLRVFATGRNLFTITGYKGSDPEVQDTGFETGIDKRDYYPRTTSWSFGVKVGF